MNSIEKHFSDLREAKKMIGCKAIGQRPGTFDDANKVLGIVDSVRETVSSYNSHSSCDIVIDIRHGNTVTPCLYSDVQFLQ